MGWNRFMFIQYLQPLGAPERTGRQWPQLTRGKGLFFYGVISLGRVEIPFSKNRYKLSLDLWEISLQTRTISVRYTHIYIDSQTPCYFYIEECYPPETTIIRLKVWMFNYEFWKGKKGQTKVFLPFTHF